MTRTDIIHGSQRSLFPERIAEMVIEHSIPTGQDRAYFTQLKGIRVDDKGSKQLSQ